MFFHSNTFWVNSPLIAKGLFYYTETFLRLHMTKFLLGIIATLLLTLTFFIYKHNKTLQDLEHEKYKNLSLESKLQDSNKQDLEHEKYKNLSLESKLQDSNKALEKIQLDTQSYLKGRDKEIQQIQNKYTKLLQEHTRKVANIQKAYESKLSLSVNAVSKENLHIKYISGLMPSNHDNKFFSSQVKLDNSHNATDTSKKSVSKHSLHTQNRDVSDITYPQHDVLNILRFLDVSLTQDVSAMPQYDVCFLSQYDVDVSTSSQHDKKHFSFLNKSNSIHNYNSHNFSYSEIPNNSNSSFKNENTCMLSLQHCQLQIQTAKTMLQQTLQ